MEKEYLKIIDDLINQGYSKNQIDHYIIALQNLYTPDEVIFERLKEFFISEDELNKKTIIQTILYI